MKLSELAVAVYLYECFTRYDKSYFEFLDRTGNGCALAKPAVRNALIKWLNKWGCRQFALKHHSLASNALLKWYQMFAECLPPANANLWELTDGEIDDCADIFSRLAGARASIRRYKIRSVSVKVGRTGAAKILFAIRPKVFPPWDGPIRKQKGYTGSAGYVRFLKDTKAVILDLKRQCERNKISIEDLPIKLGRPRCTVPKLIDEYYWVTITNGCRLPSPKTVKAWACWKP
jgi:hypothetical protein